MTTATPYFPWPLAEVELDADQSARLTFFLMVKLYRKGILTSDDIQHLREISEVPEADEERLRYVIHGNAWWSGIDVPQT